MHGYRERHTIKAAGRFAVGACDLVRPAENEVPFERRFLRSLR